MWAEMALIKKVTEKKVMFKSILSKVSHSMQKRLKFQKFIGRGLKNFVNYWRIQQSSAFADN